MVFIFLAYFTLYNGLQFQIHMWLDWFFGKEEIEYLEPISFETETFFYQLEALSRVQTILLLLSIYR